MNNIVRVRATLKSLNNFDQAVDHQFLLSKMSTKEAKLFVDKK